MNESKWLNLSEICSAIIEPKIEDFYSSIIVSSIDDMLINNNNNDDPEHISISSTTKNSDISELSSTTKQQIPTIIEISTTSTISPISTTKLVSSDLKSEDLQKNNLLKCNCNIHGSVNDLCLVKGGQCQCKSNYTGIDCSLCKLGYFGFPSCRSKKINYTNISSLRM